MADGTVRRFGFPPRGGEAMNKDLLKNVIFIVIGILLCMIFNIKVN